MVRLMSHTFSRHRGSTHCEYEILPGHQLALRVKGVLTSETHQQIAADLDRIAKGMLARSMSVDLRYSAIAMTEAEVIKTPEALSLAVRALPIAIVTGPGVAEMYRELAWVSAKLGLLRGAFLDLDQARAWAAGKESLALYFRTPEAARSS